MINVQNVVLGFVVAASTFVMVGCDNRTTREICSGAEGTVEGITGIYHVNIRSKSEQKPFAVYSAELRVVADEGKRGAKVLNAKGEIEAKICMVKGAYVWETNVKNSEDGTVLHYPSRLYVTQVGLQIQPLLFDKDVLDAAGIPNEIQVVPGAARHFFGTRMTTMLNTLAKSIFSALDADDMAELVIDNQSVTPETLLKHATVGAFGLTAVRQ